MNGIWAMCMHVRLGLNTKPNKPFVFNKTHKLHKA